MNDRNWVGCLYLEDVPAWALGSSERVLGSNDPQGDAQNPFLVLQNGQVVGASSTPRRRGVELGMWKRKARTLCPEASVHPREPTLETAAWDQLLDALNQRTPRIESTRPGLAWFEPVRPSEDWDWLRDTPFQCGIGMRRPVARLAAWKAAPGRRLRIEETHEDRFLHRVPVDALTEIGFDDSLAEQLSLFGYPTVGAAQALSSHHLSVQFGDEGEHLAEFLEGGSGRISFYSPPPSVEHTRDFEDEVGEPGPLKAALEEASRDIADRVQGKQFQRVALHLEGREQEGSSSRVLVEPRARADALRRAATALLDELLSAEMAVQALTLSVGSLRAADQQQASLFYDRPERREAIAAMNRRHPGALLRVVWERSMGATHRRKNRNRGIPDGPPQISAPDPHAPTSPAIVKQLDEPIQVRLENTSPLPTLFRWNGDTCDVKRVLEVWRKESKRWRPGGNERRDYYRCVVKTGSSSRGGHTVVIIYRRSNGTENSEWILFRKTG